MDAKIDPQLEAEVRRIVEEQLTARGSEPVRVEPAGATEGWFSRLLENVGVSGQVIAVVKCCGKIEALVCKCLGRYKVVGIAVALCFGTPPPSVDEVVFRVREQGQDVVAFVCELPDHLSEDYPNHPHYPLSSTTTPDPMPTGSYPDPQSGAWDIYGSVSGDDFDEKESSESWA